MRNLMMGAALVALAACGKTAAEEKASTDAVPSATTAAAPAITGGVQPASFDCGAPLEADEKAICADPGLARMDREMWRLYQIAIKDKQSTPTGDAMAMAQDDWLTAREQCGADADPKSCIAADYAERIHRLRQGSKAARDATGGFSEGPVAYRCKGMDALIAATFANTDPSVVYMEWADESQTLTQARTGSGAKYTAKADDGEWSFWTKGDSAMLQRPGGPEMSCAEEIIG